MKLATRRIIWYALAAAFLVIAPLIVVYSIGYTLNTKSKAFELRGGIFIKSKTPRLSIILNGAFQKQTSRLSGGALLTEIQPGTHILRIEKEGYHPWYKAVTVEPGEVIELRSVLLVADPTVAATSSTEEAALMKREETSARTPAPSDQFWLDEARNLIGRTGTSTQRFTSGVHSFHIGSGGTVFFVDKNGFLARLDPQTRAVAVLGRPGFYLTDEPLTFVQSSRGDILILDHSGGLFMLQLEGTFVILTGGVRTILFDGNGEKALLGGEKDMRVLWLEDNPYQPFQKRGTLETVLALEIPVLDAQWFYVDNMHIIFRTDTGIYLTEIDGRGGRSTVELVTGETDGLITDAAFPTTVFFQKGKTVYKLET